MKTFLSCLAAGASFVLAQPSVHADDQNPIGRFDIARFQLEGGKLLSEAEAQAVLRPFAGKNRDFADVQRALEAIEAEYRRRGFAVAQVILPEQELNQGVVRLLVIEPRIGKVAIEGNQFFDAANIRASVPLLREGETPNVDDISASLRLANENPAKKTTLSLQTAAADDEIDAVLKVVDEKPWRIGVNLDNTGNRSTGRTHAGLLAQHANLSGRDDVLSLQYTTTIEKPSHVGVYGVGYHLPLYGLGDSIDVFGSYSDVDSGAVSAGIFDLHVSGKGTVAGIRYNHNLDRRGDYESRVIAGFDIKAFKNNVELQGVQLGNDVTVRPLSLAYAGIWTVPAGEVDLSVTGYRNVPGGERGSQADFSRVRAGASADYGMLRYTASYSRALPADWLLRVLVNGQATRDALVPGEQFGAGGANSVRGFEERDIANDRGIMGSAELYTPNLCGAIQCRALAFYDAASVRRNKALPGEITRASIGSVGVGLRLAMDKRVTLQMDYGHVTDAGLTQGKGDGRLHLRLGLTY